ncbi:Uncharacterised protein [Mycobacteroides abscessus subsp. abscessus]|nr:Uncharacterised protein [Mycobacteroides abscessus subsp. abscessus]
MDPIYIPGRFRTASSPSRMVIESALYSLLALFFWAATIDFVSCLEVTTPVGPLHNRGPAIRLMTILLVCTHGT